MSIILLLCTKLIQNQFVILSHDNEKFCSFINESILSKYFSFQSLKYVKYVWNISIKRVAKFFLLMDINFYMYVELYNNSLITFSHFNFLAKMNCHYNYYLDIIYFIAFFRQHCVYQFKNKRFKYHCMFARLSSKLS